MTGFRAAHRQLVWPLCWGLLTVGFQTLGADS